MVLRRPQVLFVKGRHMVDPTEMEAYCIGKESYIAELEAEVEQLQRLLRRARGPDVPLRTELIIKNGRLVGKERQAMTQDELDRAWLNVDIDAALDTKETPHE